MPRVPEAQWKSLLPNWVHTVTESGGVVTATWTPVGRKREQLKQRISASEAAGSLTERRAKAIAALKEKLESHPPPREGCGTGPRGRRELEQHRGGWPGCEWRRRR